MKKALGFIETVGKAAAIEAMDTAVKAAEVELSGLENSRGQRPHDRYPRRRSQRCQSSSRSVHPVRCPIWAESSLPAASLQDPVMNLNIC